MEHTAASERSKYERVFAFPNYGTVGHALPHAHHLIEKAPTGATVADFGCGRGGSFRPFVAAGLRMVPVDHINALALEWQQHPQVEPLIVANLWEGPLPSVDYAICTDVMEHIPPDFVDQTLDNIAQAVSAGCLWTICHVADVWGQRIGAPLHLTIKPPEWWESKLLNRWSEVKRIGGDRGSSVYWTGH